MKTLLKALLIMVCTASIGACNPLKVTDPADPNFDPNKFSFHDYKTPEELADALRKLLPVGTPKDFVDRVLVNAGDANAGENKTYPQLWHYWAPLPFWAQIPSSHIPHLVIFDENLGLLNVKVYGYGVLYPDQVTPDDLKEEYLDHHPEERKALDELEQHQHAKEADRLVSEFDPDKFSFRDHFLDREGKIAQFREFFPIGTAKSFVDRALIDAGKATSLRINEVPEDWHVWRYEEPPLPAQPGGPVYIVIFNSKDEVANISVSGEYIYGDAITLRSLKADLTIAADSNLNPDEFRFSDYGTGSALITAAFEKLFPIGTPREFVDRVMVDAGQAKIAGEGTRGSEGYSLVVYKEPEVESPDPQYAPARHIHYFIFDKNNRLLNVHPRNGTLYEGQIRLQDIINQEAAMELDACKASTKIVDPANTGFDPDKFRFDDYCSREDLIAAYRRLFPVGTPKEFVDRVLVKAGGASCYQSKNHKKLWHCRQPKTLRHWDIAPHFGLIYDETMKLLNINPNGMGEIYPDSVTGDDLREEYLDLHPDERKALEKLEQQKQTGDQP